MFQGVLNTFGINKTLKHGDESDSHSNIDTSKQNLTWNSSFGLKPIIHICDNSVAGYSSKVFGWCMKPFGLKELPINIFNFDNKTVIQLETGKGWKIYECGQMANWALKPFPLLQKTIQYMPLSVLQQETKSVIQLESSVFCDCNQRGASKPDILDGLEAADETSDENDHDDSTNSETGYETDNNSIIEETTTPVKSERVKQLSDLLNDFYQATEEEEEFLRRRDLIRRSYQRPSRPRRPKTEHKRRRSASARARFDSIIEHDCFIHPSDEMFPDTLHADDDNEEDQYEGIDHLPIREAIDVEVKTTLKKMSRMSQSMENIKRTFSRKKRTKEKSLKERAKRMIIIF